MASLIALRVMSLPALSLLDAAECIRARPRQGRRCVPEGPIFVIAD
jgi:hypothetical protein